MAAKRYYWLKMQETFFSQKEIKKLRREGGADMVLLYLQIMLLSIKNDGRIRFDGYEDSMADEIAMVLDADETDVKKLLEFLEDHKLLTYISESELELPGVVECIGSESDAAERMRRSRERKTQEEPESVTKLQKCSRNVPTGYTEKELEKETEKELDPEKEKTLLCDPSDPDESEPVAKSSAKAQPVPYQKIMEAYNRICGDYLPKVQKIQGNRQKTVAARYKEAGNLDELIKIFEIVRESAFLTGRTNSGWKAGFDWIMKPSNYQKILEGNYSSRGSSGNKEKKFNAMDVLAELAAEDEVSQEDLNIIDEQPLGSKSLFSGM